MIYMLIVVQLFSLNLITNMNANNDAFEISFKL